MKKKTEEELYEEKWKNENGIWITPKPNYDELEQTGDVKNSKRIEVLSRMYSDKKFSDFLDMIREIKLDHIIDNM